MSGPITFTLAPDSREEPPLRLTRHRCEFLDMDAY
jgi:hypothetical protein